MDRGKRARRRRAERALQLLLVAYLLGASPAGARAGLLDAFIDPTDGQFDVGDVLLNRRGALLNPILVTEPAAGEVKGRWRVWRRWSLLGFFGLGWTAGERLGLASAGDVVPAGGGGFRDLIARQLGLQMGMDFAGSRNQFAFYFQVGGAWR